MTLEEEEEEEEHKLSLSLWGQNPHKMHQKI